MHPDNRDEPEPEAAVEVDDKGSSVSGSYGPHASGNAQASGADGVFNAKSLDVVVMEKVVEAFAVNAVLVVAEILGVWRGVELVKVARATGSKADAGPDVANNVLNIGFFDQQNSAGRVFHRGGFVPFGVPVGQSRAGKAAVLPIDAEAVIE